MKLEARIFLLVAVACWVFAAIYGFWTAQPNSYSHGQVEYAGLAGLILSGGLCGLAGSFFWFISRRIDARPEDRLDGEIAEAAGDLGFFSPGSYWPVGIAAAGTLTGVAIAFWQVWLLIVGVVLILFTVGGLLFEYYIGGNRVFINPEH